jgi:hypothetical protein
MKGFYYWDAIRNEWVAYVVCMNVEVDSKRFPYKKALMEYLNDHSHIAWDKAW